MTTDAVRLTEKWSQLTKRLAAIAGRECGNRGFAIMTVEVLVDSTGEPAFWTEPTVKKLESRLGAFNFLTKVLSMLGESKVTRE